MNEYRKSPRPSWPGEDPDAVTPQESTGFYSPDFDDEDVPPRGDVRQRLSGEPDGGRHSRSNDLPPGHPAGRQVPPWQRGQRNGGPTPNGTPPGGVPRAPIPGQNGPAQNGATQNGTALNRPAQRGQPGQPGQRQGPPPGQGPRPPQNGFPPNGAPRPPGAPPLLGGPALFGGPAQPGPAGPGQQGPRPQGPGQRPVEGETEMLPLVEEDQHYPREPELLTHREDDVDLHSPLAADYDDRDYDDREYGDLDDEDYDDYDDYDDEPNPPRVTSLDRARARKKRRWRRIRRIIYVAAAVCILGPIAAFFIAYQFLDPPSPEEAQAQLSQPVSYMFANNSVITSDSGDGGNRTILKSDQIPDTVKHAAYAAEDNSFETNPGFDLQGIGRAVVNQLTGKAGGGSTITQQYVKQATGNDQHSPVRKFTEIVKAYKMNNEQTKSEIITAYLNTIYFGRNAYGVQAAAKAYFNTDVAHLTKPQAALLGGMIQGPGRSENASYRAQRANYVMDRMVVNKWMTPEERSSAQVPSVIAPGSNKKETELQKNPYLISVKNQIDDELERNGLNSEQLHHSGAKIYTTLDPKIQQMAVDANNKIMESDSSNKYLVSGQVSVDPATGNILAYYPGQRDKTQYDQASQPHQPGSSFKPFTFLSLLENRPGAGLGSTFDGTSDQVINGQKVGNADEESCGSKCTVKTAMTESVNTVFYNIAAQIGTQKVRDAAWQAGISRTTDVSGCENVPSLTQIDPKTCKGQEVGAGIALGQYPVSVKDMAQAYGTFINKGTLMPAHFVSKVTDSSGQVIYQSINPGKPAFDASNPQRNAQLARNVVESMTDVASFSDTPLAGGRVNAAKTGTAQAFAKGADGHNTSAWMVGGTPQVVTAVFVGDSRESGQAIYGNYKNVKGKSHHYDIYGREEPAYIWQEFNDNYLENMPKVDFGPLDPMGEQPPATIDTTSQDQSTNSTDSTEETTRKSKTRDTSGKKTTDNPTPPTHQTPPTNGDGGGDGGGGNGGGGGGGGTGGGGTGDGGGQGGGGTGIPGLNERDRQTG